MQTTLNHAFYDELNMWLIAPASFVVLFLDYHVTESDVRVAALADFDSTSIKVGGEVSGAT